MPKKEEYSAKNLIKVIDKNDVQEIVGKIKASDNKTQIAIELAVFAFKYCEKLKEKNFQIYQNNIEPKLIRLEHIKKKLDTEGLTQENEDKLLFDLVIVEKEIKEESKDYDKSILKDIAYIGGGISFGVVTTLIIQTIFKFLKK